MYGNIVRGKIITTNVIEYQPDDVLARREQYLTLYYGRKEGEFKVIAEFLHDGTVVVPVAKVKELIVKHF